MERECFHGTLGFAGFDVLSSEVRARAHNLRPEKRP
jgi:hypothetical protein